jgi:hypothetical protein
VEKGSAKGARQVWLGATHTNGKRGGGGEGGGEHPCPNPSRRSTCTNTQTQTHKYPTRLHMHTHKLHTSHLRSRPQLPQLLQGTPPQRCTPSPPRGTCTAQSRPRLTVPTKPHIDQGHMGCNRHLLRGRTCLRSKRNRCCSCSPQGTRTLATRRMQGSPLGPPWFHPRCRTLGCTGISGWL